MKKTILSLLLFPLFFLSSCDILEQVVQVAALKECKFEMQQISNVRVLGIQLDNKTKVGDFSFADITKLTMAVSKGELPVEMDLNVKISNPNTQTAAMSRMDWQAYLDNNHLLDGVVHERVVIQPNGGQAIVPFHLSLDLEKVLGGEGLDAVLNLLLNLSGQKENEPSRLQLKVKPFITVGGRSISYPGYVTVEQSIRSTKRM
ncbi:MAG: hypothetical protein CSA95_08180 [Bacteroidetes bacterium]|nr:MAG: hypothetical protein CSA95_08180 [Bacteroidota bacterium]